MADEPVEARRPRGHALVEMAREDLDLFGIGELNERIADLEAEIARVRAHMVKKQAGRAAAESVFSRRD
ncbi:MAG: DUF1192 domain-containing protein [Caulobacteraceae bacterium]